MGPTLSCVGPAAALQGRGGEFQRLPLFSSLSLTPQMKSYPIIILMKLSGSCSRSSVIGKMPKVKVLAMDSITVNYYDYLANEATHIKLYLRLTGNLVIVISVLKFIPHRAADVHFKLWEAKGSYIEKNYTMAWHFLSQFY